MVENLVKITAHFWQDAGVMVGLAACQMVEVCKLGSDGRSVTVGQMVGLLGA
jgi:hypothetical protein